MIFYFTGTGNSFYAAKRLLDEDEELISIAEAIKNNNYTYTLKDNEPLGFVFPVYFYTVPSIINEFISNLTVNNTSYVYAVITCGGGIQNAGSVLKKALLKRNIKLDYVSELVMPDNSMLFYQIPPKSKAIEVLPQVDININKITTCIRQNTVSSISDFTMISDIVGKGYDLCNKTLKFNVLDKCIHCGLCEKICPQSVIEIRDNKPVWVKDKCCKCSACINRCPVEAIQYGKATLKRNRYVNPEINK